MLAARRLSDALVQAGGDLDAAAARLFEETSVHEREPKYEVGEFLGSGIIGNVHAVTREHDTEPLVPFGGDKLAMKIMFVKTGRLGRDPVEFKEKVEREIHYALEAEALGVGPKIYDWGLYTYDTPEPATPNPTQDIHFGGAVDDKAPVMVLGYYFIVMQRLSMRLDTYLEKKPLTRQIIVDIGTLFKTLLDADIAMGDPTAGNIMLDNYGRVYIIDYGEAESFETVDARRDPEMRANAKKRTLGNAMACLLTFYIDYDPSWPVSTLSQAMAIAREAFFKGVEIDLGAVLRE